MFLCYLTIVSSVVIMKTWVNVVYLCYQTITIVTVISVVITETGEYVVFVFSNHDHGHSIHCGDDRDWAECGVFVFSNHDHSHSIQYGVDRLGRRWCICVTKP